MERVTSKATVLKISTDFSKGGTVRSSTLPAFNFLDLSPPSFSKS